MSNGTAKRPVLSDRQMSEEQRNALDSVLSEWEGKVFTPEEVEQNLKQYMDNSLDTYNEVKGLLNEMEANDVNDRNRAKEAGVQDGAEGKSD